MASYNRVILMGNLTRDPQLRYLPNQTAVVDIGLAVNHRYRTSSGEDREEVMFIDCTAFGKQAEVINQYCQKGRPLLVEGRLKLDTWDDKQTGQKRSKHKITIDNFQLIGSRQDAQSGGNYDEGGDAPPQRAPARGPAAARPPVQRQVAPPPEDAPIAQEQQFKEDDIPF